MELQTLSNQFVRRLLRSVLSAIGLALLTILVLFGPAAQAQSTSVQTTELDGGTNNVAGATTNSTFDVQMTLTRSSLVSIQPNFKLTDTGTDPIVFKFDYSIDSFVWSAYGTTLSVTPNGTNTVSGILSPSLGAVAYIRLRTIENPNTAAITNLVLKYSTKPGL